MPPTHDCEQAVSWLYGHVTDTAAIAKTGTDIHQTFPVSTTKYSAPTTVIYSSEQKYSKNNGILFKDINQKFPPVD